MKNYSNLSSGFPDEREKQLEMNGKHVHKQKQAKKVMRQKTETMFKQGDNVRIPFMNQYGIVHKPTNERGDVEVLIKGEKVVINHKRLSLYIKAEDLYPDDYDMDIIFESKENRKIRKEMAKRHIEGNVIDRGE